MERDYSLSPSSISTCYCSLSRLFSLFLFQYYLIDKAKVKHKLIDRAVLNMGNIFGGVVVVYIF